MKQIFTLLALLFFAFTNVFSQKVAICGFNTDGDDGFTFVALTDLSAGSIIYFTDGPYVATTNSFTTGGNNALLTYTVPDGGLPEGQVVSVVENPNPNQNTFTLTRTGGGATGSIAISGGIFQFQEGEPLFAFSASDNLNPTTTLTELFGYVLMGGPVAGLGDDPGADSDCPRSPEFVAVQHTDVATDGASFEFDPGTGIRDGITIVQFTTTGNWTVSGNNIALSTAAFTNLSFGGFPVEWLDFKAVAGDAGVTVSWITASELNNDYFVVENSLDGVEFSALGQVEGAGNSDAPISYEFVDASPKANTVYYRVRQVDFDGGSSFTSVMMVNMGEVAAKVKMYPNPVVSDFTVDQFHGEMTIFNVAGQQLSHNFINGTKTIDLSDLKNGVYLVKLVSVTGTVETHRIVK